MNKLPALSKLFFYTSIMIFLMNCYNPFGGKNAGGGTEIGNINGNVATVENLPIAGAKVKLFKVQDINNYERNEDPERTDSTDALGHYSFKDVQSGLYNVVVESNDKASFKDSVSHSQSGNTQLDHIMKAPGTLIAKIATRLELNITKVTAHLINTDKYTNVNDSGEFTIHKIPEGDYTLALYPDDEDFPTRYLDISITSGDTLYLIEPQIELIYSGIPIISDVNITFDTISGITMLSWPHMDYSNRDSYTIQRATSLDAFTNFHTISNTLDTTFVDSVYSTNPDSNQISFSNVSPISVKYQIRILDKNNELGPEYILPSVDIISNEVLKPQVSLGTDITLHPDSSISLRAIDSGKDSIHTWKWFLNDSLLPLENSDTMVFGFDTSHIDTSSLIIVEGTNARGLSDKDTIEIYKLNTDTTSSDLHSDTLTQVTKNLPSLNNIKYFTHQEKVWLHGTTGSKTQIWNSENGTEWAKMVDSIAVPLKDSVFIFSSDTILFLMSLNKENIWKDIHLYNSDDAGQMWTSINTSQIIGNNSIVKKTLVQKNNIYLLNEDSTGENKIDVFQINLSNSSWTELSTTQGVDDFSYLAWKDIVYFDQSLCLINLENKLRCHNGNDWTDPGKLANINYNLHYFENQFLLTDTDYWLNDPQGMNIFYGSQFSSIEKIAFLNLLTELELEFIYDGYAHLKQGSTKFYTLKLD